MTDVVIVIESRTELVEITGEHSVTITTDEVQHSVLETPTDTPFVIETNDQQAVVVETAAEQGPPGPISSTGMQWTTTQW